MMFSAINKSYWPQLGLNTFRFRAPRDASSSAPPPLIACSLKGCEGEIYTMDYMAVLAGSSNISDLLTIYQLPVRHPSIWVLTGRFSRVTFFFQGFYSWPFPGGEEWPPFGWLILVTWKKLEVISYPHITSILLVVEKHAAWTSWGYSLSITI